MTEPRTLTGGEFADAQTVLAPAFTGLHAGYNVQVTRALHRLTAAASRGPGAGVALPGRCLCCMASADGELCESCVSGWCGGCAPAAASASLASLGGRREAAARQAACVLRGGSLGGTWYRCANCGRPYNAAPDVPDWDIAGSEAGTCWLCRPAPRVPLAIEAPAKLARKTAARKPAAERAAPLETGPPSTEDDRAALVAALEPEEA